MTPCVVCGAVCGKLRGATHSWQCAGILSHQRREKAVFARRDELRRRYASIEKAAARNVMRDDVLALHPSPRVLDLYGGGLSAEWFLSLRPDIHLVVAERDRTLWPALKRDARAHGYEPVYGDFAQAQGPFDFAYLDLCSEPLGAYMAVSELLPMMNTARKRLLPDMALDRMAGMILGPRSPAHYQPQYRPVGVYVTVLRQNRQGYSELRREALTIAVKALFNHALRSMDNAELVHSYPQAGGRGLVDLWRLGPSVVQQREYIARAEASFAGGADWHRAKCAEFYAIEWRRKHGEALVGPAEFPRPHAEGTCRCVRKGYISPDDLSLSREAFARWEREGRPEFPPVTPAHEQSKAA